MSIYFGNEKTSVIDDACLQLPHALILIGRIFMTACKKPTMRDGQLEKTCPRPPAPARPQAEFQNAAFIEISMRILPLRRLDVIGC